MKCVICHGDDIRVAEVNDELLSGRDIVHVPVRIPVCQTCGERYYDRKTLRYLEDVQRRLKAGKVSLREVGKVLVLDTQR